MKRLLIIMIALTCMGAHAQGSGAYLMGGIANTTDSYSGASGFYIGGGKEIGAANKYLGTGFTGNLAFEGSYASTSSGSYKSTSMGGGSLLKPY